MKLFQKRFQSIGSFALLLSFIILFGSGCSSSDKSLSGPKPPEGENFVSIVNSLPSFQITSDSYNETDSVSTVPLNTLKRGVLEFHGQNEYAYTIRKVYIESEMKLQTVYVDVVSIEGDFAVVKNLNMGDELFINPAKTLKDLAAINREETSSRFIRSPYYKIFN